MELKLRRTTEMIDKHNKEIFEGDILYSETSENGIGKTTLARTVCGLMKEKAGDIYFGGQRMKLPMRKEFVKTMKVSK